MYLYWNGRPFILEAKVAWVSLVGESGFQKVAERCAAAHDDAKAVKAYYGETKLACVFVVPYVGASFSGDLVSVTSSWTKAFRAATRGGRAWIFAEEAREMKAADGRIYPGCGLLLERVS